MNQGNKNLLFTNSLAKMQLAVALLTLFSTPIWSAQTERQIQIPALKRIGALGDLYNEKTNEIISVNVFKRQIPTEHISETQNPTRRTDVGVTSSTEKQFKLFSIDDNTAVNILTGITTPRGAAAILNHKKQKQPSQLSDILLYKYHTVVQRLWTFHEGLKDFYNKAILGHIEATHIITSIAWGTTVAVKLGASSTENGIQIKNSLNSELQNLRRKLSPSDEAESNFSMSITSDISLSIEFPTTPKEVKEILSEIPTIITGINEGRGVPLLYTLTPINFIRKHMGIIELNTTAHKINEFTLSEIIDTFQDLDSSEYRIIQILDQINDHQNCVSPQTKSAMDEISYNFQNFKLNFTTSLKKSVIEVRSGLQENQELSDLLEEFRNSDFNLQNLNRRFENLSGEIKKINFCNAIQNEYSQIQYIGAGDDLIMKLTTLQKSGNSIVLMFTNSEFIQSQPESHTQTFNTLLEKLGHQSSTLLYVDCDFSLSLFCRELNNTGIFEYLNGTLHPSVLNRKHFLNEEILELKGIIGDVQGNVSYLQNFTIEENSKVMELEAIVIDLQRNLSDLQHFVVGQTRTLEQNLECVTNPCLNGGKCTFKNNERHCECSEEFLGDRCEDRNECVYPGTCPSLSRSVKCKCREGYVHDPQDSRKCKLGDHNLHENATLIFGSSSGIEQLSLSSQTVNRIQNHTPMYRALDFMYQTNTMFWSGGNGTVYTAPILPGATKTAILNEPGSFIICLAIDWIYNHVYYADDTKDKISVANLDGTMKKVLFATEVTHTNAIVVNPLNGWVYWADYAVKNIERAGLDGSQRRVIANTTPSRPYGLTLDMIQNRLYWTTYGSHPCSINSMNPDGSDKKIIYQASTPTFGSSNFWSITTLGDSMYWRDGSTKAVYRANKCHGNDVTAIPSDVESTGSYHLTLQAYHFSKQPEGEDYCANNRIGGQCSHLCFRTPSTGNESVTTKCACPDGLTLSSNQQTCS